MSDFYLDVLPSLVLAIRGDSRFQGLRPPGLFQSIIPPWGFNPIKKGINKVPFAEKYDEHLTFDFFMESTSFLK